MRILLAPAIVCFVMAASEVRAETKIFIVENHRDGYGVDQCLASGDSCGKPVASAYCQSRKFGLALSYRKVDAEEVTGGSRGVEASCKSGLCGDYVAIECTR
jgi:hypothetical protein